PGRAQLRAGSLQGGYLPRLPQYSRSRVFSEGVLRSGASGGAAARLLEETHAVAAEDATKGPAGVFEVDPPDGDSVLLSGRVLEGAVSDSVSQPAGDSVLGGAHGVVPAL